MQDHRCNPSENTGNGDKPLSPGQELARAGACLHAGRLPEAEQACRLALAMEPENADACHFMGLIARQVGRTDLAIQWLDKAIRLAPRAATLYNSLGAVFLQRGERETAEKCFRQAVALKADCAEAHYNLGIVAKDSGDLDSAIRIFRQVISLRPDYGDAYNNLGVALMEEGSPDQAMECWRQAVALRPDNANALNNLGVALKKKGEADQAMECWRQAIALQADYADPYNNLGVAYREKGQLPKAVATLRQAVSLQPNLAEAYNNLGVALKETGEVTEAVACYRRAFALDPNYADAYSNLGLVLKEQGDRDGAMEFWRKAIALRPDFAEAYNSIGTLLYEQGHLQEAIANYRKALELKPGQAEAYKNLGEGYLDLGQVPEARKCFRKALELKPDYAEAHRHLSFMTDHRGHGQDIQAMETLYGAGGLDDEQRIHLAFGLAKAYEEMGAYPEAFRFLREGNQLKRAQYSYSLGAQRNLFDRIKRVFSAEFLASHAGAGYLDGSVIFIVGMPRSGTTLVEQILASHPEVHGAGELTVLLDLANSLPAGMTGAQFPESMLALAGAGVSDAGQRYLDGIRRHVGEWQRITDKMPSNFQLIGLIRIILPRAKIIHCVRNPLDTAFSIFKNYFSGEHPYAYDLAEIGGYYRLYQEMMDHWRQVLPGYVYDITYEQLVMEQEQETRKLLDHLGFPWNDACLSFHKTKRPVVTASAMQVRKPMYRTSMQLAERYGDLLDPLRAALAGVDS